MTLGPLQGFFESDTTVEFRFSFSKAHAKFTVFCFLTVPSRNSHFPSRIANMYRLFTIAASCLLLLVASSTGLTVVDTKPSSRRMIHRIKLPPTKQQQSSNACCADFPYCGCPKLDTANAKTYQIDIPVAKQSSGACCADYPYCSCPKLDTAPKTLRITLPATEASSNSCSCCPDYPYCNCPKLETRSLLKVGATRPRVLAMGARPKSLAPRQ